MKEIVNRLHENRQIELAREIMEAAGYSVTEKKLSESNNDESRLQELINSIKEMPDTMSLSKYIEDLYPEEIEEYGYDNIAPELGVDSSKIYVIGNEDVNEDKETLELYRQIIQSLDDIGSQNIKSLNDLRHEPLTLFKAGNIKYAVLASYGLYAYFFVVD